MHTTKKRHRVKRINGSFKTQAEAEVHLYGGLQLISRKC